MATKKNWFDEQQAKRQGQDLQSGVIGGNAPAAASNGQAKGTGWTNLQQYLEANKGAGSTIADQALKSTSDNIDQTKADINSWADAAKGRVNDTTLKDDWSDAIKGGSVDDINKIDANKFNEWKHLGNYWGVQDYTGDQGYTDAAGKSSKAQEKIDTANTWQGQQGLMRDTYGNDPAKRYSTGMGVLDAFVARGDAQGKFDAFKQNNQNFGDTLKTAQRNVNTAIGSAKDTGGKNYKSVMDAIAGRIGTIQGDALRHQTDQIRDDSAAAGSEIDKKYKEAGVDRVLNGRIRARDDVAWNDVANQVELDALNRLGGWDDDASTGGYAKSGRSTVNIDWTGVDEDIARAKNAKNKADEAAVSGKPMSQADKDAIVYGGIPIIPSNMDSAKDQEKTAVEEKAAKEAQQKAVEESAKTAQPGTLQIDPDALTTQPTAEEKAISDAKREADKKALEQSGQMPTAPGTLQIDPSAWQTPEPDPQPVSPPGSLLPWYGWDTQTRKKIYTINDFKNLKAQGRATTDYNSLFRPSSSGSNTYRPK